MSIVRSYRLAATRHARSPTARLALETDGRTELLKMLDQEDPPRAIRCGCAGCTYLAAGEEREQN